MPSKIGWCTSTINVCSGCRNYNTEFCGDYCYARRMALRLKGRFGYPIADPFRPTFHPEQLSKIYRLKGKGKRVFLNSMGDLFSVGVKAEWINAILEAVKSQPDHFFLILTKRPDRISLPEQPNNLWIGTSITKQTDLWRLEHLRYSVSKNRFISFEPLHGHISDVDLTGISWVILGQETGNRKGIIHAKYAWVEEIISSADAFKIPIFLKNNIWPVLCGRGLERQELPAVMR